MPVTAAVIMGGSSVVGGLMGQQAAAANREAAMQAMSNAQAQFAGLNVPDETKQQLILESLQQQGVLTPEMLQNISLGDTGLAGIQTDPKLAQAQMQALESMQRMGATGLQAQDMASLNQVRRSVAGDEQARQQAILQQMAARGQAGGGAELAARLQSSQSAADRASQQSDQLLAMAQNRMLQATAQAGQLGGSIRGQQYGELANAAQAQDAINRFNAQQAMSTQASNVGARNQAQAANLAAKQQIANANVAQNNAQQQYNKQLLQQKFQNQMALASGRAGIGQNMAQFLNQAGQQQAQGMANIGAGIGQAAAGAYMMGNKGTPSQTTMESDGSMGASPAGRAVPSAY